MPIVKANEPLGPRPLIIAWYGDPGIGKTSLFNTCNKPLLIDGDRGVSRSIMRKDTLVINNWDEVLKHERDGDFKGYKTIGIDTPKAILDDFLMSYVISNDPKLRTNKLGAYGEIGNQFKLFLNNRRLEQADIAIVCHSRKDDDSKRMIPDVTGQSLNLILRVADMIGYYTIINGKRMLSFDPTEGTFGKNVARIEPQEVPEPGDPRFKTFMSDIYEKVRAAIASQSEEQLEAMKKSEIYQNEVATCETPDDLTALLEEVNLLPDYLKAPLRKLVMDRAKEKGWIANKDTKRFEAPPAQGGVNGKETKPAETAKPAEDTLAPAGLDTSFDDRVRTFNELGMASQIDMLSGFGLQFPYATIEGWTEDEYLNMIAEVNTAKKRPAKPSGKRQTAGAR